LFEGLDCQCRRGESGRDWAARNVVAEEGREVADEWESKGDNKCARPERVLAGRVKIGRIGRVGIRSKELIAMKRGLLNCNNTLRSFSRHLGIAIAKNPAVENVIED